jgi:hypothetical protein
MHSNTEVVFDCILPALVRCSLWISAGTPGVVTEAFSDCPQTLLRTLHMEENIYIVILQCERKIIKAVINK